MWETKKMLVTVKTYPNLSTAYEELVCTAGILEDGSWIRLYPVPYRHMADDKRYKKYHWVEVDVKRRQGDMRPESYEPKIDTMKIVGHMGTERNWESRKKHVLRDVRDNMASLIKSAHANRLSLATFKPRRLVRFASEAVSPKKREEHQDKMHAILARREQMQLIDDGLADIQLVDAPDCNFYYAFEDVTGKESRMQIEDWEIQALYRKCLRNRNQDKKLACADVRKKYWDDFALTKEIYLFLGTTLRYHQKKMPNPFTIIGVFHPKPESGARQEKLL